ncbi:MAG: DUF2225 domain-containing protein [Oscillospiraceae bacterium]
MIDIKILLGSPLLKKFASGTMICSENDRQVESMYIIVSGKVGKIMDFTTPNEKCAEILESGMMFGEMGVLCHVARDAAYVALEDVNAAVVNKMALLELIRKSSETALQIMDLMCNARLRDKSEIKQLNDEKNKLFKISKIGEDEFYKSMLFPDGHKEYNVVRPVEYEQFLFKRAYTCPHCQTQFNDFMQLSTKLIPQGQLSCDMRRKYKDFEPLWYDVMTCPNCYFSALEGNFNAKIRLRKERYEQKLDTVHNRVKFNFEQTKNLDNVFASYYIALICADGYDKKEQIKAKIWLYLSWLYNDVENKEMEIFAAGNAYEAMLNYLDTQTLPTDADQSNNMILGALAKKIGKNEDAIMYLNKARRATVSKPVFKQLAEREIDEIREATVK